VNEALLAAWGAWRLAHADASGLTYFDRSIDGFWRSFRAAIIVAPGYAVLVALRYQAYPVTAGWPGIAAVEAIGYVIQWAAYPLVMEALCRRIGREREYVGYIAVYNWSALLQVSAVLLAAGVERVLPGGLGAAVLYGVQLALLLYSWFIARLALNVGAVVAAGIVALDVVLSVLIEAATQLH